MLPSSGTGGSTRREGAEWALQPNGQGANYPHPLFSGYYKPQTPGDLAGLLQYNARAPNALHTTPGLASPHLSQTSPGHASPLAHTQDNEHKWSDKTSLCYAYTGVRVGPNFGFITALLPALQIHQAASHPSKPAPMQGCLHSLSGGSKYRAGWNC